MERPTGNRKAETRTLKDVKIQKCLLPMREKGDVFPLLNFPTGVPIWINKP